VPGAAFDVLDVVVGLGCDHGLVEKRWKKGGKMADIMMVMTATWRGRGNLYLKPEARRGGGEGAMDGSMKVAQEYINTSAGFRALILFRLPA
jgi:hypothetical protein